MKRLLFLINSLSGGGAEKVLIDLINILPKKRYDITVIALYGGIHEKRLSDDVHYRKIIKTSSNILRQIFLRFWCKLVPYKLFALLFTSGSYDIKIAYLNGFPTRVLANDPDKQSKKITFVHSDFSKYYGMEKLYKSKELCLLEYKSFDKVCFVAKNAKDGFFQAVGLLNNWQIIHNVIDIKGVRRLASLPVDQGFTTPGLKIISVGRLVKVKAFERLIHISVCLKQENIPHEIWILGEGVLKDELQSLIDRGGVQNFVSLKGFKSNPYQYVSQADIYVCSSIYEGYSTSVAEALALGVPVLTTQCSGMDEILNNGQYGTIVSNDESSLREEVLRIARNDSVLKEYREKAKCGMAAYSPENSIREYVDLFDIVTCQ